MKRAFPIWFAFLVALVAAATAQSLDLTRARVPGGGGVSAGGQFTLFSTVGQPEVAPRVAGGAFTLDSGFLGATLPSPIPTVYFPSGTVTVPEDSGAQTRVNYATFEPGDAGPPVQPATFQLANNNVALFSAPPAMDPSRTLTFTPAPNANGTASVTVVVRADGVNVATNTFAIVVTAANDAPAVTLAGNQSVLEDANPQTVSSFASFTAGPANESSQTPTYTLTADNPALFSAGPAVAANGTLTYTPAANANGSATITVVTADGGGADNGGVDRTTNTFTITVTAVNDAPSVAYATNNVVVLEDAGAQSLSGFATFTAGPADEAAQTPAYTLTANSPALFSSQPVLAANGTLTFTPAPNANGAATITVITADGGGTANGGVDRATNTFTITVTAVNDAPVATYATNNVAVLEDAGAQTLSGFATFIAGPADESAQMPAYTLTADSPALFSAQPAVAANGTLTFTPAANANGSATVSVVVADTGTTVNGGVDRSTNTFTITITAVNDAPGLTLAQNTVTVLEDAGAQSLAGFATFSPGPANEFAQTLIGYAVSHNNSALFSTAPALAANGTLTFTPAANANGSATVTVIAQDNGGVTNGGGDRTTNTFTITVTAVNDAPSLAFSANPVVVAIDAGPQTVTSFATFTPGPADEVTQTPNYTVTTDNAALFSAAPAIAANGTLTFTTATGVGGAATVTVVVQDTGGIAAGGVDKATNTFTLSVLSFAGVADSYTLAEDGTLTRAAAAGVLANDIGPSLRAVLVATTTNGALTLNLDGSFTYQPATNFFGTDHFTYLATNSTDTSAVTVVTLTVASLNDAPVVTLDRSAVTVLEDSGASSVIGFATFSPGPASESAQTLVGYTVSNNRSALFSVQPTISSAGVLTFTPSTNANGSATITVIAQDSGGTTGGGVDRSTNTFTIAVTPVNDAPSVTFTTNLIALLEDAGPQSVASFATFTAGPANESGQGLFAYTVSNSSNALFSVQPAIDNAGRLTFAPATNANGSVTVTVVVQDNGGAADGGVDRSTNTFTLMVTTVNDAPGVALAQTTVTVLEDAGAQSFSAFASFSPGAVNESAQALLGYTVTVDNPALFSATPAINHTGVLTFTPGTNANGSATVTVVVQDNGGTTAGGVDKSTNTFTILVTAVNDAPVANNDSYAMSQGDVLTVAAPGVLANDTDVEGSALIATKLTNPAHGTITLNANGGFTYTPDTSFHGVDSYTYRVNDGSLNSVAATVSITVLARPVITPPPGKQRVFSSAALRFSATNAPDLNAIRVGDPDSTTLTLRLDVTNGTLGIAVTNGLAFPNGFTNTNALVLAGPITSLNDALESLTYVSTTNYFGDDALVLVAQDEGGRTNRGNGVFDIQVVIPARGPSLDVSLNGFNNPGQGRTVTNATAVTLDTNLVQGVTYDPTNNVVRVQPVGGQDGATNRSSVTVLARYSDGTTELITVPVIIYNPLLTTTTNNNAYDATFTVPLFNLQTSLYEQKVRVQNNTPFDFTALRLTATNLPATVTLQNATFTNGGLPYIEYNLTVAAGSNVTLKLEYFSSDLATFTPGLRLELLNQQRTNGAPADVTMSGLAARRGFSPDGASKNYLKVPTQAGRLYYVQYQDVAGSVWKTSPVVLRGTGFILNWLDDGPPNTETPPGSVRFYRVVTER
ncbi:MAG: hypothetical protein B9S33_09360 [Pedosphaera sp. Tous-C6FEB]|nr:MAG: hypothetical protein B9S33_09360 [Pedosphaera sp. Tous-C6FEB]